MRNTRWHSSIWNERADCPSVTSEPGLFTSDGVHNDKRHMYQAIQNQSAGVEVLQFTPNLPSVFSIANGSVQIDL